MHFSIRTFRSSLFRLAIGIALPVIAQSAQPTPNPAPQPAANGASPVRRPPAPSDKAAPMPTRADTLRGAYGLYRANNHLLSYHLTVRVDPEKKFISGKNTIRFRMLADSERIQIDLTDKLDIDKILMGTTALKYTRDSGAVFIDFPEKLLAGKDYSIDFYYSGNPPETVANGAAPPRRGHATDQAGLARNSEHATRQQREQTAQAARTDRD